MKIFISGKPGSGKSKLIKDIIKRFEGIKIAGILSPEIRKNNCRIGFKIIEIPSGKEEILASVKIKNGPKVSKYKVNIRGINKIIKIFEKDIGDAELVVIDEVGKMELFSKKFKECIERILKSEKMCLVVLHRSLIKKYGKFGKIFWLENNYENVLNEITNMLNTVLQDCNKHAEYI